MLQFTSANGDAVRLDDDRKTYLVDFWATRCAPCIRELPELIELQTEMARSSTAEVVLALSGTASEEGAKALPSAAAHGVIVYDTERVEPRLGIDTHPTKLLIRNGTVIDAWVGASEETSLAIRRALQTNLAQQPGGSRGQ